MVKMRLKGLSVHNFCRLFIHSIALSDPSVSALSCISPMRIASRLVNEGCWIGKQDVYRKKKGKLFVHESSQVDFNEQD